MTTQTLPASTPAMVEDEGSVVAITLSWPSRSGNTPIGGGADQLRGFHIIELIGDVDVYLAGRVRDILMSLAAQGADLTLDVSEVRLIDAGGPGVLAAACRRVRESGGQLSLIGAGF